jgi:hypothetical protein
MRIVLVSIGLEKLVRPLLHRVPLYQVSIKHKSLLYSLILFLLLPKTHIPKTARSHWDQAHAQKSVVDPLLNWKNSLLAPPSFLLTVPMPVCPSLPHLDAQSDAVRMTKSPATGSIFHNLIQRLAALLASTAIGSQIDPTIIKETRPTSVMALQ